MNEDRSFPTMIIPSGTEITVNEHGELAIRTPGNLVIQNSGTYSVIECGGGSLRIDPDVRVEAATVKAADTCYVAGNLTAWRVKAKKVVLEKGSQAFIMLRESEVLELDRQARLVGNFNSEKELYLLLGRFNDQLRHLPQSLTSGEVDAAAVDPVLVDRSEGQREQERPLPGETGTPSATGGGPEPRNLGSEPTEAVARERVGGAQERAEVEALLQILAQRELMRPDLSPADREALQQAIHVLRSQSSDAVETVVPGLLAKVANPSPDLARMRDRLEQVVANDGAPSSDEAPW